MMIVSDVQEKQKLIIQPNTALNNQEFESAYKMLPIQNEDSLNSLKDILCNDALHDQTVSICEVPS